MTAIEKINAFICEQCGKQYQEPYINCPDCFTKLQEIKTMQTRRFKLAFYAVALFVSGIALGLALKESKIIFACSVLCLTFSFYCAAKLFWVHCGIIKKRSSL
jgi:DNA-directed RNA polymerase subunit RPC12/RpoP